TVFVPILDLLIGNRVLRVHRVPLLTEHCPLALNDLEQRRRHLRRRRSRIHKRPRTEIEAPSHGFANNGEMRWFTDFPIKNLDLPAGIFQDEREREIIGHRLSHLYQSHYMSRFENCQFRTFYICRYCHMYTTLFELQYMLSACGLGAHSYGIPHIPLNLVVTLESLTIVVRFQCVTLIGSRT